MSYFQIFFLGSTCDIRLLSVRILHAHTKTGEDEDVKLVRTGPKELSVLTGNVNVNALSAKKIAVDGVDLTKLLAQSGGGGGQSGGGGGGGACTGGGGGDSTKKEWSYFATDLGGIVRTCAFEDCMDVFSLL